MNLGVFTLQFSDFAYTIIKRRDERCSHAEFLIAKM